MSLCPNMHKSCQFYFLWSLMRALKYVSYLSACTYLQAVTVQKSSTVKYDFLNFMPNSKK